MTQSRQFGLPLSVAVNEEPDKVAFVLIDVPQALETLEGGVDASRRQLGSSTRS